MSNKICKECGTENEEKYLYCKNCGMALENPKKETVNSGYIPYSQPENSYRNTQESYQNTQNPYNDFYNNPSMHYTPKGVVLDNISGISSTDFGAFIGKKAVDILPKFSKMEFSNSKTSWCWPVAVLGYFFGPMGAALWFFYRKMYKPAVLLAVIGAILSLVTGVLTFSQMDIDINSMANALEMGDVARYFEELSDSLTVNETFLGMIGEGIDSISSILTCVLCGLYGFNIYKKHCVKKINEIKFKYSYVDQTYYHFGIAALGGTSGGALALGIFIMIFSLNFASAVAAMIYAF